MHGRLEAVNPAGEGTKVAGLYVRTVPAQGDVSVRLRLRAGEPRAAGFADFDAIFAERIAEADAFYAALQEGIADADMRRIQRQAFAGMLWSKQFYYFNVRQWLDGDPAAAAATSEPQAWPQLRLAITSWPPTSCRCRTSGNIPGSPPGIWRSIASRCR